MNDDPELRIAGGEVAVSVGRKTVARAAIGDFVATVARAAADGPNLILPSGVRLYRPRGPFVGVAVEVAPQARKVRWIEDDSQQPFGKRARYRERFLAFPYVVLLLVLRGGHPTGWQQLYYRRAPLESELDQELLLPNLTNVARAYEQRCWLCLQHLARRPDATLAGTIRATVDHVFNAAFNRSAEVHEGNSYWGTMRDVDPRVATLDAWEEATRQNRWFALEVPWKSAETTASSELAAMLDQLERPLCEAPTASQLAGLVTRAGARRKKA
jgi:hypothetical protein